MRGVSELVMEIIKQLFNAASSLANFEIQKYYQNEPKFNGVYSRDNLTKIKDGAYVINLDEYSDIGTHCVALHVNNDNNNNNNPTETRKYCVDVQWGIVSISWGDGPSLALVGNPSRDGVSIKILVWRHLKPNPQLL